MELIYHKPECFKCRNQEKIIYRWGKAVAWDCRARRQRVTERSIKQLNNCWYWEAK